MENSQPDGREASGRRRSRVSRRSVLLAVLLPIWVLVGFVLASLIVGLGIYVCIEVGLLTLSDASSPLAYAVSAGLLYLLSVAIVIGIPIAARRSRTSLKELGLDRLPSWQDILLAPAGYVIYVVVAGVLLQAATSFLPGFDPEQVQDVGFQHISKHYEIILAFLTLVVMAPVAEEILMRGYLYGKLRKIVPIAVAIIITSVLFGFLHGQWNVAIDVFALSLVLTSLREATGSIWAAILLHMIKNGIAFYVLFINPSILNTMGM